MDLFDEYESKAENLILRYSKPNQGNYKEIFCDRGIRAKNFEEFIELFFSEISYCLSEGIYYVPWVKEVTNEVSNESFTSYMNSRRDLLNIICKDCGFSSIEDSFFNEAIEEKDITAIECGIYDYFVEDIRLLMLDYKAYSNILDNLKGLYDMYSSEDKDFKESTNKSAWKYNNLLRG